MGAELGIFLLAGEKGFAIVRIRSAELSPFFMSSSPTPDPSFEEAMERLDEIVESMEGERLALDEMVGRYEEGVKLLTLCRQRIDHARMRVERINVLLDGSGKAMVVDFDVPAEGGDEGGGGIVGASKGAVKRGGKVISAPEADDDIRLF